jgi:CBS domain-containing protein
LEIAQDLLKTKVAELKTELVAVPSSAPLTKVVGTLRKRNAYEAFIIDDARIGMVSIRDILRAKHVHSRKASSLATQIPNLAPETLIREAAAIMTDYRVRALPIVKDGEAIGEITALSICKALHATTALDFSIDKVMTSHPISVRVDDPLAKAKALMSRRNIDHLPVLQDGKTVGVVLSHRLLDSMIPPERSMRRGWTPETRALNRLSVKGLMERPLICDAGEKTSSVLSRLIDRRKSYTLVGIGEEVQGIVTYRDFISKLLVKRRKTRIPAYIVGLPDAPFEAEAVRSKFTRAINLLKKSFPEILEARCTIKTSSPEGKRGRKRYEVKALVYTPRRMFVYSQSGWDLPSIFDVISKKLKKTMTRRRT